MSTYFSKFKKIVTINFILFGLPPACGVKNVPLPPENPPELYVKSTESKSTEVIKKAKVNNLKNNESKKPSDKKK